MSVYMLWLEAVGSELGRRPLETRSEKVYHSRLRHTTLCYYVCIYIYIYI